MDLCHYQNTYRNKLTRIQLRLPMSFAVSRRLKFGQDETCDSKKICAVERPPPEPADPKNRNLDTPKPQKSPEQCPPMCADVHRCLEARILTDFQPCHHRTRQIRKRIWAF
jgi:hypothetical protein